MCGRFAMNAEADELIREFVAAGGDLSEWTPRYSIAPSTRAPIVRTRTRDDGTSEREIGLASWGLRPAWAKSGPAPINARLETVATNGMFRSAFVGARCLVPMSGYFEWMPQADGKQPYFLHASGTLAAAGLYAARREGEGWQVSFTVVTREAQDAAGEVHARMPAFLAPEFWDEWLNPTGPGQAGSPSAEELLAMTQAVSRAVASTIVSHPVSRRVNNVRTADPADATLIAPIELADAGGSAAP